MLICQCSKRVSYLAQIEHSVVDRAIKCSKRKITSVGPVVRKRQRVLADRIAGTRKY